MLSVQIHHANACMLSYDDCAVYCSFLETNLVYLWEGYVLHGERCDKNHENHDANVCMLSYLRATRLQKIRFLCIKCSFLRPPSSFANHPQAHRELIAIDAPAMRPR